MRLSDDRRLQPVRIRNETQLGADDAASRTRPLISGVGCRSSRFVSGMLARRVLLSDLDQLDEILDTEVGEREDAIVVKAVDPYDAILDLHFKGDVVQQVYIAEVSGEQSMVLT